MRWKLKVLIQRSIAVVPCRDQVYTKTLSTLQAGGKSGSVISSTVFCKALICDSLSLGFGFEHSPNVDIRGLPPTTIGTIGLYRQRNY